MRLHPVSRFVVRFCAVAALCVGVQVAAAKAEVVQTDRLSVEVMGQGPDVILIPGYASSREVWRPVAEALAPDYRVHLVQLAGFAGEPWSHGDGPFLQPAVEGLIAYAEGLDRPAVIGHSMGGLSGLMMAQQKPEAVSKVMSVDSLPFFGAMQGQQVTAEQVAPVARQMGAMIKAVDDGMFRQQQTLTAQGMMRTEAAWAAMVDWSLASDRSALATAIADVITTDVREGLPAMTTPVWAIYAADANGGAPAAMADSLWQVQYASLPGVRLERVDDSRHFIMIDQPQRMLELIREFLK
jgi:pimeloyl-[acyl-carrier protein] methyl ester esterase